MPNSSEKCLSFSFCPLFFFIFSVLKANKILSIYAIAMIINFSDDLVVNNFDIQNRAITGIFVLFAEKFGMALFQDLMLQSIFLVLRRLNYSFFIVICLFTFHFIYLFMYLTRLVSRQLC